MSILSEGYKNGHDHLVIGPLPPFLVLLMDADVAVAGVVTAPVTETFFARSPESTTLDSSTIGATGGSI